MKNNYFIILFLWSRLATAHRNPFSYPDGSHRVSCTALGLINGHPSCATVLIDGRFHLIKLHDEVEGYTVVALAHSGIALKNSQGILMLSVPLKKVPSTCAS